MMNSNISNDDLDIHGGESVDHQGGQTANQLANPLAQATDDPTLANTLTLRSDLKFETRIELNRQHVVIEDCARSKFFRIGEREYQIIALLNGTRTGHDIANLIADTAVSTREARELTSNVFQWLLNSNLVHADKIDNGKRLNLQSASLERAKLIGWLNPISFKFSLFNPNQILKRLQPVMNWLFSSWFLVAWLFVGAIASWTMFTEWDQLTSASAGILSGYSWVWLLVTWLALKIVHETAHGIACRRFGGEVPEAGVLLLLFTPMAYVNVTSMWRFPNRWNRMVVSGAGMYVELFVSFVSLIVWSRTTGLTADIAFNIFIMSSVTTVLFNANPLMRFDGYFLLSDLLAIPNLYGKGTKWFSGRLKSICFGMNDVVPPIAAKEKMAVMIYGCLAYFWKISISVSLILGASVLFQGAGLIMSTIAFVFWFGIPIFKQIANGFGPNARQPANVLRTGISLMLFAAMATAAFWLVRAPATKSAPAIVKFANEEVIRADADGFIQRIHVVDGQQVSVGQVLMELDNPALANEVFELERRLDEAQIQTRIFRNQKEQSLAQAETQKCEQLKKQLDEKREQADGLRVVAPFDGFIFKRGLENRIGNFVSRGDALMNAAKRSRKEVVVSIDQRDFDAMSWQQGDELKILFPGQRLSFATLSSIDPRATSTPQEPSLCAAMGGPLSVKHRVSEGNEFPYELLHPRFRVTLQPEVETSRRLFAGQRGRVFFLTTDQSIGTYFLSAAHDWLTTKLEIAIESR